MSILRAKRIFISGGAGVIGSEIVPLLHAAGAVVMVGDLKPRPRQWSAEILYRQGDLNEMLQYELDYFAPDVFIHLAATFERSTESYGFWDDNFRHNVQLSHHLMTLHKDLPSLKRVIFASSYLIYDPSLYSFSQAQSSARRLREEDPILPRNLTGMAKLAHEIELRFLKTFRQEQFTTVIARIYRGYGRGSHCVISRWIRALLKGEAIKVYRPEGIFDYIYAGDTAAGLIKLVEHPEVEGIINLGTDRSRRVSDVLDVLRSHFPHMVAEEGESDIPFEASQANMDRFRQLIGWTPPRSLEDTMPLIIDYYRNEEPTTPQALCGNVLVSSAAKKIPLLKAVQRAQAKTASAGNVIAADASASALAQYVAAGFWKMPFLKDLSLVELVANCRKEGITRIIPTRDGELSYYAEHREDLGRQGIQVMISGLDTIRICLDKLEFYRFCKAVGLPAIETLESLSADTPGKWVVKERFGAGSQSMGINLTAREALAHATMLEKPIFQPLVEGHLEYSADAYVTWQGQLKGAVVRSRDVVENGESQVTTTVDCPSLIAVTKKLAARLPFYGHLILQAFVTSSGDVELIECNPRFGGASTLAVAAGLDSFHWFLLEAAGENLNAYPFAYNPSRPLRQVRVAQDQVDAL